MTTHPQNIHSKSLGNNRPPMTHIPPEKPSTHITVAEIRADKINANIIAYKSNDTIIEPPEGFIMTVPFEQCAGRDKGVTHYFVYSPLGGTSFCRYCGACSCHSKDGHELPEVPEESLTDNNSLPKIDTPRMEPELPNPAHLAGEVEKLQKNFITLAGQTLELVRLMEVMNDRLAAAEEREKHLLQLQQQDRESIRELRNLYRNKTMGKYPILPY